MTPNFFVTGGTLGLDTLSYVPRKADANLFHALAAGEFCYVLTSRQMGKSSLMVRTASRLRESGVAIAVIDLTAIGVNVTANQWYGGLTSRLGGQLNLVDQLEQFDEEHVHLSPLLRWVEALESIVLTRIEANIVIFIDEIDIVRSLPFSADEFFAALRQCFNRRSEAPAWRRLTFCLLGVATPSDLISDPYLTPFNIGQRIEVSDFVPQEAAVLRKGFHVSAPVASTLLARVLYWTGGHPYLTQRLCEGVAADNSCQTNTDVDRICRRLFLAPGARDQDDNLVFVRERLLRGTTDPAAVLDLYDRILHRRPVPDVNNAHTETLKLAGIVDAKDGQPRVRNRIYERAFDASWVRTHMPDAEVRRQRAAFYRGLVRAASIATVIVLLLAGAFIFSFYQWVRVGAALQLARASEQSARQEHQRMLQAVAAAEAAVVSEQAQRKVAQRREAEANALREEATRQQRESDQLRKLAELREQDAQRSQRAAVESFRKMQLAYRQLLAEQRSVEERGALFAAIPEWLQSYSADAVASHAQQQVEAGNTAGALQTYAEFCDLALADDDGFWVRELVRIEPDRLRELSLNSDLLETRIRIAPDRVAAKVLTPGITLGERAVSVDASSGKPLLATLYDCRARMLFQHPELGAVENPDRLDVILACYDRAIELDDSRPHFYVARGVVRFLADATALDSVESDLQAALSQYPVTLQPPRTAEELTPAHHDLALVRHSLGNVTELQAASRSESVALLDRAIELHAEARALDPSDARYLISLARAYRKRNQAAGEAFGQVERARSISLLTQARDLQDSALLRNEWGETLLVAGDIPGARAEFDLAVQLGSLNDPPRNRYRYFCNQANAYWRSPTSAELLIKALSAAELATQLQPENASDAEYYRGLALWSLAKETANVAETSQKLDQATTAFDRCLRQDARHIGAILARCQMQFERQDRTMTPDELRAAITTTEQALQLAKTRSDRAKGRYVYGLGMLRKHLDREDELALMGAMQQFLAAAESSDEYVELVAQYMTRLAERQWKRPELRVQAAALHSEFAKIPR